MKSIYPYQVFSVIYFESIIAFFPAFSSLLFIAFSFSTPLQFYSLLFINYCIHIYVWIHVYILKYNLFSLIYCYLCACFHIWQTLDNKLVCPYTGRITSLPPICTLFPVVISKVLHLCRSFLMQLSLFIDIILFSSCLSCYVW